jgi:hypothetical protein
MASDKLPPITPPAPSGTLNISFPAAEKRIDGEVTPPTPNLTVLSRISTSAVPLIAVNPTVNPPLTPSF